MLTNVTQPKQSHMTQPNRNHVPVRHGGSHPDRTEGTV